MGAYIDFGVIFHTIRVTVNGQVLPPLDTTWAKADISALLVDGQNMVEAVVSTTLNNALRPVWTQLKTSGIGPSSDSSSLPVQDYGLLMPVVVTPFLQG